MRRWLERYGLLSRVGQKQHTFALCMRELCLCFLKGPPPDSTTLALLSWRVLLAELGATVSQACVVTLNPVTTRIDEPVERTYLEDMPDPPEGEEIEMPDETVEPLPAALDLGAVMAEALALALPPWPRAEGVEMEESTFAEPGTRPMTDEDTRPFAGLRDMMRRDGDDT